MAARRGLHLSFRSNISPESETLESYTSLQSFSPLFRVLPRTETLFPKQKCPRVTSVGATSRTTNEEQPISRYHGVSIQQGGQDPLDPQITFTWFKNVAAKVKSEKTLTFRELVQAIPRWAAEDKSKLPLIKLAIGNIPPAEAEEAFYANLNTLDMVP